MNNTISQSIFIFLSIFFYQIGNSNTIRREAKSTLTPIEMNIGDALEFKLRNGQIRTLILKETDAEVIITNLNELGVPLKGGGGGTLYHFTCKVIIDGHPMSMERYVGSQESLYEPYVINGMRIWFDGVAAIFDNGIVTETHGKCKPGKDARFAVNDMTDRICPETVYSFYDNKENFIPVNQLLYGYDAWMGAYFGYEAHGGMDVNMPPGSPNYTPIAFDNQYYFNSLAKGDNNNRWRGIRKWENGDRWTIQDHHIINLLIPEQTPVDAGIHFAEAAGVNADNIQHSHFVFKITTPENADDILLDPWILFWQAFEDNKKICAEIKANIAPLSPGKVGVPISFSSERSISGIKNRKLSYYWTFGDGGWSNKANPEYTYANPRIYPVTLVVDNGAHKRSFTQHITIDGEKTMKPAFVLTSPEVPSFRKRPVHMMDSYGVPVRNIPHTLSFVARESRSRPDIKTIQLENIGTGILSDIEKPEITYQSGESWLQLKNIGKGNNQKLEVAVDATGLPTGIYRANIQISSKGSLNETQSFLVEMNIPTHPPNHWKQKGRQVVNQDDIRYNRFYRTPYFWVRPQFGYWKEKGYYNDYYYTNGGRDRQGEYARFTPDIEAGTYKVFFADETPFEPKRRAMAEEGAPLVNPKLNPDSRFAVRVKSKNGEQQFWIEPSKSRVIGVFEFEEGMDGFVEVLAKGSTGQMLVDAVIFDRINQ